MKINNFFVQVQLSPFSPHPTYKWNINNSYNFKGFLCVKRVLKIDKELKNKQTKNRKAEQPREKETI